MGDSIVFITLFSWRQVGKIWSALMYYAIIMVVILVHIKPRTLVLTFGKRCLRLVSLKKQKKDVRKGLGASMSLRERS